MILLYLTLALIVFGMLLLAAAVYAECEGKRRLSYWLKKLTMIYTVVAIGLIVTYVDMNGFN